MKLTKFISGLVIAGSLTNSTPTHAFTDEAIKLAREFILENGEKIARGAFAAIVGKILEVNKAKDDIEKYNNLTDSICVRGAEGFAGCVEPFQGGTTTRSCGGIVCGLDPKVAFMIEATCGMLSTRNRIKAAEFETSRCAHRAWGTMDPEALSKAGVSQKDVVQFKKNVLVGIIKTFEPEIAGVAAGPGWDENKVDTKLSEYLTNDKYGIEEAAVNEMKKRAADEVATMAAWNDPKTFANQVAGIAFTAHPSEAAKKAAANLPAGSRKGIRPTTVRSLPNPARTGQQATPPH